MNEAAQLDFRDAGSLDESSPTPLYLQLQKLIQEAVRAGRLRADEALPSERDLSKQLGISRVTVRKALAGLVEKGMLVQRWGSGTFIAPAVQVEQPLSRLSSFTDDMLARGLHPGAVFLGRAVGAATPKESMALGLSPGELVSRFDRLRTADDLPMAIEHAVVPNRLVPDPESVQTSLYAVLLNAEQARLLQVQAGTAALYIERRSFDENGTAVEFTSSYYRGDAYDFVAELSFGAPGTE